MQVTRKHSKKRDAILKALCSTTSHPNAQWIYERARAEEPNLSLGTVYRNLSQLRQDGQALFVGVVDGEERFDGTTRPHPHFVCEQCSAVEDLPEEVFAVFTPEHSTGHNIDFNKTMYQGICAKCLSN